MHHPALFQSGHALHLYIEERGGVVLAWESTPLWLRMHARMKPETLKGWAVMVSTATGMRRALLVPKAAMSGEDKIALRRWQAQRRDTFARINDRDG
jgi:hypothetical protein